VNDALHVVLALSEKNVQLVLLMKKTAMH